MAEVPKEMQERDGNETNVEETHVFLESLALLPLLSHHVEPGKPTRASSRWTLRI